LSVFGKLFFGLDIFFVICYYLIVKIEPLNLQTTKETLSGSFKGNSGFLNLLRFTGVLPKKDSKLLTPTLKELSGGLSAQFLKFYHSA